MAVKDPTGKSGRVIRLREEEVGQVSPDELTEEEALILHRDFGRQIDVAFPGPLVGSHYRLRPKGYAGIFPVGRELQIRSEAKVPVENLFGMIDRVYRLRSYEWLDGWTNLRSVGEAFEFLVEVLIDRTNERIRCGLYRGYVDLEEDLRYVRGRLLPVVERQKVIPTVRCRFPQQTADLDENRILAWTFHRLRGYEPRKPEVRRGIRRIHELLRNITAFVPFTAGDCEGRAYHRLNHDYRLLHALCRFILDASGPSFSSGDCPFTPFYVHMPTLFESFVADWLGESLSRDLKVGIQHRAPLEGSDRLSFRIDLTLHDVDTGQCLAVLDTKYKTEEYPDEEDVQQVVAYAVRMNTSRAFLIYPDQTVETQRLKIGSVEVRTICFDLSGNLVEAGSELAGELLDLSS